MSGFKLAPPPDDSKRKRNRRGGGGGTPKGGTNADPGPSTHSPADKQPDPRDAKIAQLQSVIDDLKRSQQRLQSDSTSSMPASAALQIKSLKAKNEDLAQYAEKLHNELVEVSRDASEAAEQYAADRSKFRQLLPKLKTWRAEKEKKWALANAELEDRYAQTVATLKKRLKASQNEVKAARGDSVNNEHVDLYKDQLQTADARNADLQSQLTAVKSELAATQDKLFILQEDFATREEAVSNLENTAHSAQISQKQHETDLEVLRNELKTQAMEDQLQAMKEVRAAREELAASEARVSELEQELKDTQGSQESNEGLYEEINNLGQRLIEASAVEMNLKQTIATLEQELEATRASSASGNDVVAALQAELASAQQAAQEAKASSTKDATALDVAKSALDQSRAQVKALEAQVESARASSASGNDEVAALQAELVTARRDLTVCQQELDVTRTSLRAQVRSLEDRIQEAQVASVSIREEEYESTLRVTQLNLKNAEEEIQQLRTRLTSSKPLQEEVIKLQTQLSQARTEMGDLESQLEIQRNERSSLSTQLTHLQSTLEAANRTQQSSTQVASSLRAENETLNTEITRLRENYTQESIRASDLEVQVAKSNQIISQLRLSGDEAQHQVRSLQEQVATIKQSSDDVSTTSHIATLRSERDDLHNEVAQLRQAKHAAAARVADLEAQLQSSHPATQNPRDADSSAKISDLEALLGQKQELLTTKMSEIDAFKSQMTNLRVQLDAARKQNSPDASGEESTKLSEMSAQLNQSRNEMLSVLSELSKVKNESEKRIGQLEEELASRGRSSDGPPTAEVGGDALQTDTAVGDNQLSGSSHLSEVETLKSELATTQQELAQKSTECATLGAEVSQLKAKLAALPLSSSVNTPVQPSTSHHGFARGLASENEALRTQIAELTHELDARSALTHRRQQANYTSTEVVQLRAVVKDKDVKIQKLQREVEDIVRMCVSSRKSSALDRTILRELNSKLDKLAMDQSSIRSPAQVPIRPDPPVVVPPARSTVSRPLQVSPTNTISVMTSPLKHELRHFSVQVDRVSEDHEAWKEHEHEVLLEKVSALEEELASERSMNKKLLDEVASLEREASKSAEKLTSARESFEHQIQKLKDHTASETRAKLNLQDEIIAMKSQVLTLLRNREHWELRDRDQQELLLLYKAEIDTLRARLRSGERLGSQAGSPTSARSPLGTSPRHESPRGATSRGSPAHASARSPVENALDRARRLREALRHQASSG